MTTISIAMVAALAAATYLSAINLALLSVSRSAIHRRLEERGRPHAATWLDDRLDDAVLATSLLRMTARVTFLALVLAQRVGLTAEAVVHWSDLVIAAGISIALLWLVSTVLSTAIARYAGVSLIVLNLPLLRGLVWLCTPLTQGSRLVDEAVRRLAGADARPDSGVEEELLRSIEDTHRDGGLDEESAEMLENVVAFRQTDVGQIMTPRTDIQGIELTDNLDSIIEQIEEEGHSRIPVYKDNLDHIVGILYVKDLLHHLRRDRASFRLQPILRQPIVVPETKPVHELLREFQHSEVHMAIVIDEYGGTAGLVTIEDVLEEIVGEIRDEHEPVRDEEPTLSRLDESHAEVDGRYRVDDLNAQIELGLPEDEDFDTVAGFMLARLGRVPQIGESIETDHARFTVLAGTATHIRRIGIKLLEPAAVNGPRVKEPTTER
jgi:putative hemolysin